MSNLLLMHGINHAMFGKRDPAHYGSDSLADIEAKARAWGDDLNVQVSCFQSDIEGEFARAVHAAYEGDIDALVVNAGAWTHYSYGILDALLIFKDKGPIVEVHMSHVHNREPFRHQSVIAPACIGQISGFGVDSYHYGIQAAARALG